MAPTKGEHGTCDTVTVKGADGEPTVINAHDYDPKEHTLHEHQKHAAKAAKAAKVSHKGETKAERKQRLADEKQEKKDEKQHLKDESDDLDSGESV